MIGQWLDTVWAQTPQASIAWRRAFKIQDIVTSTPAFAFHWDFFTCVFFFFSFFSGAEKVVLLKYKDRTCGQKELLYVCFLSACAWSYAAKTLWIAWSHFALCSPCVKTQPEIGLPQPCYNFRPLSLLLLKIMTATENISGHDCCPL